jgi:putrescine importer
VENNNSIASKPKRLLSMSDLVLYGIILIQPIAPVGIFGLAAVLSRGQVVTPILLAMVAMMCTALSYGRLAALYPSAGSAYTYVRLKFSPEAGFFIGWAMCLTYLVMPIINGVYAALTLQRLIPSVPFGVWAALFALSITVLNVKGISSISQTNRILILAMTIVIVAFMALASRYIVLAGRGLLSLASTRPFFDSRVFDVRSMLAATSLSTLTFIGFDGITTLAEETIDPRRTVPRATVWLCAITGVFSSAEVYIAQLAWPDYTAFHNPETAFMDVTQKVGGVLLFQAMGVVLVVACFGTGLTGLAAAARLLYGMGRDDVLPKRPFGVIDPRRQQPTLNICLIGGISFAASLLLNYETTAELLNFGAFVTFMGVNASAMRIPRVDQGQNGLTFQSLINTVIPAAGLCFCLVIWWNLSSPSKTLGYLWLALGLIQLVLKTKGLQKRLPSVGFDV